MILLQALLLFWLFRLLLPCRLYWLAFLLAAVALIPVSQGNSLATALRALWGDPSVTTIQLITLSLIGSTPQSLRRHWIAPLFIGMIGLVFYPLALGAGNFDPYRLGYQPGLLVACCASIALALWWRGRAIWLWLLAVDLMAYAVHLLESSNFWDYLIDPLLVVTCLLLAARKLFARRQPAH